MTAKPWPLREVTLKVLDLRAQTAFYESFGLQVQERNKRPLGHCLAPVRLNFRD